MAWGQFDKATKPDGDLRDAANLNQANVILTAGQTSQWLVCTDFKFAQRVAPVPSGATITGVEVRIHIAQPGNDPSNGNTFPNNRNDTLEVIDVQLVKTGATSASYSGPLKIAQSWPASMDGSNWIGAEEMVVCERDANGTPTNRFGWTTGDLTADVVRSSNFGVRFRVRNGEGLTAMACVDVVQIQIIWEKDPELIIEHNYVAGVQAPFPFIASACGSPCGSHNPLKCEVRWIVEGPEGWSMTVPDPRPRAAATTKDCATDMAGWVAGWVFDKPGTYTVTAQMYDDSAVPQLLGSAAEIEVVIAADSRTAYYVAVDGSDTNTGTTETAPWATLAHAVASISDNSTIFLKGGETYDAAGTANIDHANVRITSYGGSRAQIDCTSTVLRFRWHRPTVHDIDFVGDINAIALNFSSDFGDTTDWLVYNVATYGPLKSFIFCTNAGDNKFGLVYNCSVEKFDNYAAQIAQSSRIVVVGLWGGGTRGGDNGFARVYGPEDGTKDYGAAFWFYWCKAWTIDPTGGDSGIPSRQTIRLYTAWSGKFQCSLLDGSMRLSSIQKFETQQVFGSYFIVLDGVYQKLQFNGGGGAYQCNWALLRNCFFDFSMYGTQLVFHKNCEQVFLLNCDSFVPSDTSYAVECFKVNAPPLPNRPQQFEVRNCILLMALNDTYANSGSRDYHDHSTPGLTDPLRAIRLSSHNAWPTEPGGGDSEPIRFTTVNGSPAAMHEYTFPQWLALTGIVDSDARFAANLHDDFSSSNDFLPPSTMLGHAEIIGGIHRDYRGVLRNGSASSWYPGCRGNET